MLAERKKRQILELSETSVKRYRCHGRFLSADHLRPVPLDGDGPADHVLCRSSFARDLLYVEGVDDEGRPEKIMCGGYSEGLLNELNAIIGRGQPEN